MSYEYKEDIQTAMGEHINHLNILDDALEELDHVYAQAAKADEYEAKAQAFDKIVESYEYFNGRKIKVLQNIGMDTLGIVGRYINENGDRPC